MRERKSGKIVNISSTAGHATDGRPLYSTAKAGVNHYTKMLAQQLRPYNITCNALSPGPTRSGRWLANTGTNSRTMPYAHNDTLLQRTQCCQCCAAFHALMGCLAAGVAVTRAFSGSVKEELVSDGTLDRIGTLEDVSRVMEFFAGPLSGFVTGQTLIVDGGGTKL